MDTLRELQTVETTRALPEQGLPAGARGTVVHVYRDPGAFEVEFPGGQVCTLRLEDLRPTVATPDTTGTHDQP